MNRFQFAVSNKFPQLRVSQSADLPGRGYRDGKRRHGAIGQVHAQGEVA
jgi:hypothetical protein